MNLLIVKESFAEFMGSFDPNDVDLVMQYMELAVVEYNTNTQMFMGKEIVLESAHSIRFALLMLFVDTNQIQQILLQVKHLRPNIRRIAKL